MKKNSFKKLVLLGIVGAFIAMQSGYAVELGGEKVKKDIHKPGHTGGGATEKQIRFLKSRGIDAKNMSKAEAYRKIHSILGDKHSKPE